MRYILTNCKIYTGYSELTKHSIVVNGVKIEAIIPDDDLPSTESIIDLKGINIAPGFIDLQVNGSNGLLFNETPDEVCIANIYEYHKRYGTTNFLPTLITTSMDNILRALWTVEKCMHAKQYGVLGLHLEGPYIGHIKSDIHDKRNIRALSADEIDLIIKKGKNIIKIITLAPEVTSEEYIRRLAESGMIISAGHSKATYEQATRAFGYGVSGVTHLFNAMSPFNSREPGLVGATLDSKSARAGIIADGLHVHYATIRIAKRVLGNRLFLITDAMAPTGSKKFEFSLGNTRILCKDGICVGEDGRLAGSTLNMAAAVRNCVKHAGIPIDEALRMASTYPAEYIGMGGCLGKILPGYFANIVLFDDQINVKGTVIYGKCESYDL